MVSDDDVVGPAQGRRVGGPWASRYFLMVALWIPNSRSIALSDIPWGGKPGGLSESPFQSPAAGRWIICWSQNGAEGMSGRRLGACGEVVDGPGLSACRRTAAGLDELLSDYASLGAHSGGTSENGGSMGLGSEWRRRCTPGPGERGTGSTPAAAIRQPEREDSI